MAREMTDFAALAAWPSVVFSLASEDPVAFLNLASRRVRGKPLLKQRVPRSNFQPQIVRVDELGSARFNGKVLFVLTNSFPYSTAGYAQRSHKLLQAIRSVGVDASAMTRLGYPLSIGRLPDRRADNIDNVLYKRAIPRYYPRSRMRQAEIMAQRIVAEAQENDISVLHTTTPWWNAVAVSWAAKQLSVPWVYEVRGLPEATWASTQPDEQGAIESEFFLRTREKENEAIASANLVITLSETLKQEILKREIGPHKLLVAPNSISKKEIGVGLASGDAKRRLGLPNAPLVGSITSLVEYEGLDTLISALEHLPDEIHVLLVGDGAARVDLEKLAKRKKVEHRVIFTGRRPADEIDLWYSALDVFVMPRICSVVTAQVTPIKALQAAAQGVPVVCSDLPALREVTAGEAEYVPAGDPSALAGGIKRALEMNRRVPPWIYSRTWDVVASSYLEAYSSL